MAEELPEVSVGEFETVSSLLASNESLQIAFAILVIGLIIIIAIYRKFSQWVQKQKFNYTRPHLSRFARKAVLPFFAIALVSSINIYIQTFQLFEEEEQIQNPEGELTAQETFAKMLNTINILVIGYTVSHLIPIALNKRDKSVLEREDFEQWVYMRGFPDDEGDFFHKLFKWTAPKQAPEDMSDEDFQKYLQSESGKRHLERYRTSTGHPIGSYEQLDDNPFEKWKQFERKKFLSYYEVCITGKSQAGRVLRPGVIPSEIYAIDNWREQKRLGGYEIIIPGARPPGYAKKKSRVIPKSAKQVLPIGIFIVTALGVAAWWGIDLVVLATATGGLALGVGLALKETMENYFAYILIRKDRVVKEGDRVQLESGYNGHVHKITPRVTYIRHGLYESLAIIPTRQLVSSQIINYTKEFKLVPATVEVGVSYLNNPRQVTAILVKVGRRAMEEVIDSKGGHLVRQKKCPYVDKNKLSCGCDKNITVDFGQPTVRFNKFDNSSLSFSVRVFARTYGQQFQIKNDMRLIMYEEFKKYDIRIPWPIRTVYQGSEKREASEIGELDAEREKVVKEFGPKDIGMGPGEED